MVVEALTAGLVRLRDESALSIIVVKSKSRVALAFSKRTVVTEKGSLQNTVDTAGADN